MSRSSHKPTATHNHRKGNAPTLYFSRWEKKKPVVTQRSIWRANIGGALPRAEAVAMTCRAQTMLSIPWSKSSPVGVLMPVRRAWIPSSPSSWWPINCSAAATYHTHAGMAMFCPPQRCVLVRVCV